MLARAVEGLYVIVLGNIIHAGNDSGNCALEMRAVGLLHAVDADWHTEWQHACRLQKMTAALEGAERA